MTDLVPNPALTEQQSMAAYYLSLGMAPKEIAEKVGVRHETISVWRHKNEAFKVELEKWKGAQNDQFGITLVRSQLAILGLTEQAAAVAQRAMEEVDEEGQPTSRALKAAIEVMRKVPLAIQGESEAAGAVAQAAVIVVRMDGEGKPAAGDIVIDAEVVED